MTRILVTGGAGFIGSHLVDRLLEQGHSVTVLDDLSYGSLDFLPDHQALEIIEGTLDDLPSLTDRLRGVETIYHLAALISSHDSLHEPERYLDVNVGGTLRVIELARDIGAKRILFTSSSTVYGNAPSLERAETDVPQPITVYALSKLTGEHLLAMYAGLYGFSATVLRLFNVYGPRQSPNHPYANVTCKFAYAGARGGAIDLYGDGEQSRDFVYVDDVVAALLAIREHAPRPFYNVGTGTNVSINQLLHEAEAAAGVKLERRQLAPWPNDIRAMRADISRLVEDFGFAPEATLADGMAATVAYFRQDIPR